jgi:hypothetical protein
LVREIYPPILNKPVSTLCELYNGTFAVEEKKVFGGRNGEGGVGFFAVVCNFRADLGYEDLFRLRQLYSNPSKKLNGWR